MRSQSRSRVRRLGAALCLSLMVAAGVTFSAGAASAAEPFVLESCSARVVGEPGQQIALSTKSVEPPILAALAPLDPLGVTRVLFKQVWSTLPPIPIGSIPASGQVVIGGDVIANAVATQLLGLPVLAPVIEPLLATVWTTIASTCTVVGEAVGTVSGGGGAPPPAPGQPAPGQPAPGQPAPGQPAPGQPAPGQPIPGRPGNPTAPGMTTVPEPQPGAGPGGGAPVQPEPVATAPHTANQGSNVALEYPVEWATKTPGMGVAPEGVAVLTSPYGADSPVPQFGIVGPDEKTRAQNRATTGHATPLADDVERSLYGPILLATLLVTLVAAQGTRMWLLRRTAPAGSGGGRLGLRWGHLRVPMPVFKRTDD
ncbi:hypothetical protein [Actinokineospora iranica]|uniref:Uncharacterized protein n=1 Tax=Actinokineospora iranica TaxID=1271860 RepID=A0A1G6XER7_9PSEU|nr:hypothetical protein [Actinokineospora iranica]SDD76293.1 hypothetical protein SAMN05216174_11753 [Actinokineospora iranica]